MVMWKNGVNDYGLIAQALHWAVALMILALIALGWWMTDLGFYDPWYHRAPALHKAFGMAALGLALVRIVWVVVDRPPPLEDSLGRWERVAAAMAHRGLYLLTLAIPVTGYLLSTARGEGVELFGGIAVPALLPPESGREAWAGQVHTWLAYGTLGLVALHALAALKHQFFDKDGTLRRMAGVPRTNTQLDRES